MSNDAPESSDHGIVRKLTEGIGLWAFSAVGLYVVYDMWQRQGLANNTAWVVGFYVVLTAVLLVTALGRTTDVGFDAPTA